MTTRDRPLSPHLQIYRPQLTSVTSILHRATGVALAIGMFLLCWWLVAAATGSDAFAIVQEFIGSWLGRLLLFGWSFAVFYHLCNGIRHLFWDGGKGFELSAAYASGWTVIISASVLTVVAWIWGYSAMGG